MARLPEPGRDAGQWGEILNDFLLSSLNDDGSLKSNSVASSQLQDGSVTSTKLSNAVLADIISDAAIVNDHLIFTTRDGTEIDLGNVKGAKGDTGEVGNAGPTGPQGNQGAVGSQGDKGENGDKSASTSGIWSTASQTVNGAIGPQSIRRTLQTNVTLALSGSNPGSAFGFTISLTLRQDVTGGRTITWPAEIIWPEKTAPVLPAAPNAITVVHLYWDGGNWFGAMMGQNFG